MAKKTNVRIQISTLRDLAARAGFNASDMRSAKEIREGLNKLYVDYPGLCDQHTEVLNEFLYASGV